MDINDRKKIIQTIFQHYFSGAHNIKLPLKDIKAAEAGQQGIGSGYWTTTRSHISDTSRLHDNKYYQEYSYEIQSDISLNKYRDIAGKVLHVAGTKLFGAVIKNTKIDMNQTSIGSTVEIE